MPHDHPHHHHHDPAPQGAGHNHADADHLRSHMHAEDEAADLQVLATQFIDGFVQAADKAAYLRLAGVPFEKPGVGGPTALKLVDVQLKTEWQVGTASPSFGSRELSYLPYPGTMVSERTNLSLVYVSMDEKITTDVKDLLASRKLEFSR